MKRAKLWFVVFAMVVFCCFPKHNLFAEDEKPGDGGSVSFFGKLKGMFQKSDYPLKAQSSLALPRDEQLPTPPLPAIGEFIDMPGTGGKVEFTRITEGVPEGGALAHAYSRRLAIDPFYKYVLLKGYLYNLSDFSEFKPVPLSSEYVPSMTQEDEFIGIAGNSLQRWNAVTDELTDIWTAPEVSTNLTIGRWEGQQSWDDKYIALSWETTAQHIGVVDLTTGELTGQINASEIEGDYDWADISPHGTYVVVGTSEGVYRYNIDFSDRIRLNTNQTGIAHGDLMLDVAGNEVMVQEGHFYDGDIAYTILNTNTLHQMNLIDTRNQKPLKFPNASAHISGQASDAPGRVLVSLQRNTGMTSMFVADLVPGQKKIYRWGHSHTAEVDFHSEAQATISTDARSIVWTSNWMSPGKNYEFLARIKTKQSEPKP